MIESEEFNVNNDVLEQQITPIFVKKESITEPIEPVDYSKVYIHCLYTFVFYLILNCSKNLL